MLGSYADGGAAGGGLVGVPHSAQNLAAALSMALQLVQCFCVGVPHSPQNFAPAGTEAWQLLHATIASAGAAGAGAAAAGAGAGAAAAACCA